MSSLFRTNRKPHFLPQDRKISHLYEMTVISMSAWSVPSPPALSVPQHFSHICALTDQVLPGVEDWILEPLSGTWEAGWPCRRLRLWRKNTSSWVLPLAPPGCREAVMLTSLSLSNALSYGQLLPGHLQALSRAESPSPACQNPPFSASFPRDQFPEPLWCT